MTIRSPGANSPRSVLDHPGGDVGSMDDLVRVDRPAPPPLAEPGERPRQQQRRRRAAAVTEVDRLVQRPGDGLGQQTVHLGHGQHVVVVERPLGADPAVQVLERRELDGGWCRHAANPNDGPRPVPSRPRRGPATGRKRLDRRSPAAFSWRHDGSDHRAPHPTARHGGGGDPHRRPHPGSDRPLGGRLPVRGGCRRRHDVPARVEGRRRAATLRVLRDRTPGRRAGHRRDRLQGTTARRGRRDRLWVGAVGARRKRGRGGRGADRPRSSTAWSASSPIRPRTTSPPSAPSHEPA